MWIPILIIVAMALWLLVIIVVRRPAEFTVTRSLSMMAPASAVFPHVNTLRQWEPWSPWAKMDPNAKSTFEGPESGVGSSMAWSGNNKVGAGKMTITDSKPDEQVQFRLDFYRPMKATNAAVFTFEPKGNQTLVTWSMSGKNGFMGKLFGLIVNCDKMIGSQFDQGLASLRAIAEGAK